MGQYLQPTKQHLPVSSSLPPPNLSTWATLAQSERLRICGSGPWYVRRTTRKNTSEEFTILDLRFTIGKLRNRKSKIVNRKSKIPIRYPLFSRLLSIAGFPIFAQALNKQGSYISHPLRGKFGFAVVCCCFHKPRAAGPNPRYRIARSHQGM